MSVCFGCGNYLYNHIMNIRKTENKGEYIKKNQIPQCCAAVILTIKFNHEGPDVECTKNIFRKINDNKN